jgi:hypothetical protein
VLVTYPLKLAAKYQVDGLQNRIISHLKTDWQTTLDDWDDIAYSLVGTPKPDKFEKLNSFEETSSQTSADELDS